MTDVLDYQNLITSEYTNQPNFMAMVGVGVSAGVQVQALMTAMIALFDLDTPPVGDQLDIIGQIVGVSRNLEVPITGVLFSWDATAAIGWDSGVWPNPLNPDSITTLDDASYLLLIRARIAANQWDGTTEGAYSILKILFPDLNFVIQDYQNMTYSLGVEGMPLDALTIALITQGYLPLRPEGVEIVSYFLPVDSNPLFAWDSSSESLGGWGTGSWAMEVAAS
jgi:hypothetical protein